MILCIRSPLKTVSILSDVYDRELVATIGWAKQVSWPMVIMIPLKRDSDDNYDHCTVIQVPGFTDLTLNDQMKLLQSSWTEVAQLFTNLSVIPTRSNSFWLYNTHLVTTCQRVRRNTCNNKILVRFPNPLAPGSDIQIHVSWETRLQNMCNEQ